jgi:hypothetical protein
MLALIFIPARTFRYWQGWVYVAVFIICSGAYTVYLAKHDPALLKRRTEAGISHEKEFTQKVVLALLSAACIILVILPPFDVRFGWPLMPWQVSIVGDALVAFSFYIFYLVSRVNTYAAANVRVEQGQKVISTGVYGFVRSNGQTRSLDRSLHPRATRANITKETSRAPVAACTRVFHFGKVRRGVPQKIPRRSPAPPPRKFISKIFLF